VVQRQRAAQCLVVVDLVVVSLLVDGWTTHVQVTL
jgi:hypothetical protein